MERVIRCWKGLPREAGEPLSLVRMWLDSISEIFSNVRILEFCGSHQPAQKPGCSKPTLPLPHRLQAAPATQTPQPRAPPAPPCPQGLRSRALWRRMWSKNLVLLANIPPQVGQATTFSCVWLRRCSRSLQRPLKLQLQSGEGQHS